MPVSAFSRSVSCPALVLNTAPNAFEFVGIQASKPIRAVFIDTRGGASENEGIAGIWTAP
ncbi:hypothetical protein JY651_22735 [Pyxidicoccus parkwayensis]|uniref:Uncharacterized protein n=1 Tax=Pyxidicoccus parkwayensis TaxID=2813578 RepID=A0ABX7PAZ0_9BACT|nr:hypothetical protein [Pyxidicoccus parkwaysis]QSQ27555.1 hypothetical protein JY651_22735 [Pyxidicoccus parkwaysis]